MSLNNATPAELKQLEQILTAEYEALKAQNLSLDITRGKPSSEQLDLADALDGILKNEYIDSAGVDTRNYGGLRGIMSARQLGASLLGTDAAQTMSVGNSSLNIMYMVMLDNFLYGCRGKDTAWNQLKAPKMLCPVPGYDRHFSITENLGIEMINVDMDENGPDMDQVEALIKADSDIIGMWCVPKYSNPSGATYSDEVVDRIAALGKIANKSFRVMWDNAYAVHDLVEDFAQLANISDRCKAHGTEDSVWQFASTSKVTHAGSGISFVSSTEDNLKNFEKLLGVTTIGADKVNQLRTVKLLPDMDAVYGHMAKHRAILAPKFDVVLAALDKELNAEYATWTKPEGGYFVSLDTQPNLAKTVIAMSAEAGVVLTGAGAPYPYGNDPKDCNIRIAPSFPPMNELKIAINVLIVCIKLATVRQIVA